MDTTAAKPLSGATGGRRWLVAILIVPLILAACGLGSSGEQADDAESGTPPAAAPTTTPEPEPTATEPLDWWMWDPLPPAPPPTPTPTPPDALGPSGLFDEVQVSPEGEKHLIPLDLILNGGVAKDGIPSIDQPQFATREGWEELDYDPDKLVIGVEVDGLRRAYPFQVLVWHELVNDTINGKPILISYCPLCGSAIAFEREVAEVDADGQRVGTVEFGVSGLLYNSDLLMYDRKTDTLWSQILGVAVVGELTGARLNFYPSEVMTWADWQATYPDSEVLTRNTGPHERNYDRDPYGEYYLTPEIWFPTNQTSGNFDALYQKKPVTGVELPGQIYGAYANQDVVDYGPINDRLGDTPLLIAADPTAGDNIVVFERTVDGRELTFVADGEHLVDEQTGSRWTYDGLAISGELSGSQLAEIIPVKSFWFAWVAFHPETEVWQPE